MLIPTIYSVNPKYAFRGELLKFLTDNFKRYLTVKQVKVVNGKWTASYRPYVKLKTMYQIDLSKPIIEETDDSNN
jgi:UDP-3-O-acyl-N-acetylglucosamine deacetylase